MALVGGHLLAMGSLSAEDGEENDSRPHFDGGLLLGSQYRNLFWNNFENRLLKARCASSDGPCRWASFGYGLTLSRGWRRE
jgi:hypothetical protein